jgi:hypothetical protein
MAHPAVVPEGEAAASEDCGDLGQSEIRGAHMGSLGAKATRDLGGRLGVCGSLEEEDGAPEGAGRLDNAFGWPAFPAPAAAGMDRHGVSFASEPLCQPRSSPAIEFGWGPEDRGRELVERVPSIQDGAGEVERRMAVSGRSHRPGHDRSPAEPPEVLGKSGGRVGGVKNGGVRIREKIGRVQGDWAAEEGAKGWRIEAGHTEIEREQGCERLSPRGANEGEANLREGVAQQCE